MIKSQSKSGNGENLYGHSDKLDLYPEPKMFMTDILKLVLLCHSAEIEAKMRVDNTQKERKQYYEVYEDEHGECATFSKICISGNDRLITLKKIIENKFGIACSHQIIVYKDKIMKNDLKFLYEFNLKQHSRIHIFDERDLDENMNEIRDDVYGVYEEFASSDSSLPQAGSNTNRNKNIYANKNTSPRFRSNEIRNYSTGNVSVRNNKYKTRGVTNPRKLDELFEQKMSFY